MLLVQLIATTDNAMLGERVILLFEDTRAGTDVTFPSIVVTTGLSSDVLSSTSLDYSDDTTILGNADAAKNVFADEARGLAYPGYNGTDEIPGNPAKTTDRTNFL